MRATRKPVEVRMFGPLELRVDRSRLGPRDFPKDRIADLLWGERLPQRVTATIETYVSVLRRRLDSGSTRGRDLIETERGGYRLAAGALAVDVDRYESLLRSAAAATAAERRSALDEAVVVGDPELLADEPYAAWVIPTREHYRERQLQALVDLAECCLELDDFRAAVAAVDRVLALEPTRERAYRAGMRAHRALGDRDAALWLYERCRSALAAELGVAPTAQTATLHASILRDERLDVAFGRERLPASQARAPIGFARNGGVRIAYQVVGEGPVDLAFSPSSVTNLAATWDEPTYAAFLERLASMARLILFDKRGTGLSDPALDFPTTRERSEDLVAVLDAIGSERAVLFGVCGGGALCAQLAADHPERTAGLVLHNSMARVLTCEDYPWGWTAEMYAEFLASFDQAWLGNGDGLVRRNPGLADNPRYRDWFASYVRLAANPWMARRLSEMNAELDIRASLERIRAPCLVICRTDDVWISPENSRYLARRLEGAQLVELPGVDHDPWVGDVEPVLDSVEAFLSTLGPVKAVHTSAIR